MWTQLSLKFHLYSTGLCSNLPHVSNYVAIDRINANVATFVVYRFYCSPPVGNARKKNSILDVSVKYSTSR